MLNKKKSTTQVSIVQALIMDTCFVGKSRTNWVFKLFNKGMLGEN